MARTAGHTGLPSSRAPDRVPRFESASALSYAERPLVIVAEDDAEMRTLLWRRLTNAGYRVRTAGNGSEALEILLIGRTLGRRTNPAAVVTDLRMGGMDGLELVQLLHELDPGIPVVAITAFGDPETHAAAARRGARLCLDKPFEFSTLLHVLKQLAPMPGTNP